MDFIFVICDLELTFFCIKNEIINFENFYEKNIFSVLWRFCFLKLNF